MKWRGRVVCFSKLTSKCNVNFTTYLYPSVVSVFFVGMMFDLTCAFTKFLNFTGITLRTTGCELIAECKESLGNDFSCNGCARHKSTGLRYYAGVPIRIALTCQTNK